MRTSRTSSEHREAVSRRLAQLGDELSLLREPAEPPAPDHVDPLDVAATHTRIRPGRGGEPGPAEPLDAGPTAVPHAVPVPPPVVTELPLPGRHAARRPRRGPVAGLGATLGAARPARLAIGPAQLSVLAVGVAVALAVACWWLLRSGAQAVPVATGRAPAAPLVTPTGMSPAASPVDEPTALVVDVAGRVRRPGIAVLEPGARVVDAIEAAGGARPGVDLSALNLARRVVDGEQILVGRPRAGPGPGLPSLSVGAPAALVNLNTAGQAELEALPEIGPVTAGAIIAWRDTHGGFTAVDQLLDVDGIGEATLSQVAPLVTV